MNQEYMKEKPVLPLILSMSTPMMLSMLVQSLYNIIDSIFVAKIGEDALAAVSLVYPLQNLITALTVGFGVGMNARIAFYLGAGEKEKADTATSQGIFLGTVHGILVTIAGLFFAPVYLRMYTQDERVLSWSIAYANIIFGMSALLVVGVTFEKGRRKNGYDHDRHDGGLHCQHYLRSADDLWNRIFPEDGRAGSSRCNRTWLGRNIGLLSVVLLQRQGDVKDTHERDAADKRDQCQNVPGGNPGNLKYGTAIPADLCIERNVSRIFPDVCGHFRYLF